MNIGLYLENYERIFKIKGKMEKGPIDRSILIFLCHPALSVSVFNGRKVRETIVRVRKWLIRRENLWVHCIN